MKNSTKTILTVLATAVITAVVLFALFIFFLPTLGPRFLHPMMVGNMPHNQGNMPHDRGNMPFGGMMMGNDNTPADLDFGTDRLSDNGQYQVSFASNLDPIAINQMHSWVLSVTTAEGQPVENATISVDGGMPQHGHGLPTRPEVTEELGNGDYLVEGLRFQMGGWWELSFTITDESGQSDSITFNIQLEG